MTSVVTRWVAVSLLAVVATGSQSKPQTEPLWKRILRFAGLASNPVNIRGDKDFTQAGDVWVYDRKRGTRCQITSDPNYRSPIFLLGDEFILALRWGQPVRLPAGGGPGEGIRAKVKLARLVAADANSVLVFAEDGSAAVLDLLSGEVSPSPGGLLEADQRLLDLYRGPERIYDDKLQLSVKPCEDRSGLEPLRWSDVFLTEKGAEINVSDCDGAPCGQPALSFDRNRIVYVRGRMSR